ncbi:MAG: hypothetical protein E7055_10045 [Lentisphaerae bacterium]|nr:hypothetical protein [Lentisphaerota bacterium]
MMKKNPLSTVPADPLIPLELPELFHVFYSDGITKELAAPLRFEDASLILPDGTAVRRRNIRRSGNEIDFGAACPDPGIRYAAVSGTIRAEKPCRTRLGIGVDWWFDCFCNGQHIFGTTDSGNGVWPPAVDNFIFDLPLRAGRNELVIFTRRGTGSWKAVLGAPPETGDPDRAMPPEPPSEVLYGPYLTNPGPDHATVSYVVQGRQPLELEYRKKGCRTWRKLRHLRGGQLIDEGPVVRFDLTGLEPDTVYQYRALRRLPREFRQAQPDAVREFRTFSSEKQAFSFWMMSDTHVPKRAKLRLLRTLLAKRSELRKADLFFHLGDFNSYLDNVQLELFDSFLKLIPAGQFITGLRGNHEFDGWQATHFLKYLSSPDHKSYHAFRIGEIFFLGLDTGHHLPKDSKNSFQRYTGLNELDTLLEEQREWLETVVRSEDFRTAKYRIVMGHVAPHSLPDGFKHMVPRLRRMTAKFFRGDPTPYPIDLWIAGHTHLYQVSPAAPKWRFPMIVLGGGSKKYYEGAAFYFKVNAQGITFEVIDTAGKTHAEFRLSAAGKTPVLEPVE